MNVIATACFSPHTKVMVAALQFFLGMDEEPADSDDDDVCDCHCSWAPVI